MLKKQILQIMEKLTCNEAAQLSICFVDDEIIKEYNLKYRGKNKATDVLSFENVFKHNKNYFLGDILISLDTAILNSKKNQHSLILELLYLITHGILHLQGYKHSVKMFKIQDSIYKELYDEHRNS